MRKKILLVTTTLALLTTTSLFADVEDTLAENTNPIKVEVTLKTIEQKLDEAKTNYEDAAKNINCPSCPETTTIKKSGNSTLVIMGSDMRNEDGSLNVDALSSLLDGLLKDANASQ